MLSKNDINEEYDSNGRLNFLMQIERISEALFKKYNEIKKEEEKKIKYKDLMEMLKEGKVQKKMKFWHNFEDKIFMKLARKDSLGLIEKELEKSNKELPNLKKEFEEIKKKLIQILIINKDSENNINDLDSEIFLLVENDYSDAVNKNK